MKQRVRWMAGVVLVAVSGSVSRAESLAAYSFFGSVADAESAQAFIDATPVTMTSGSLGFGTANSASWTAGVPYARSIAGWTAETQTAAKAFTFTLTELAGATFTPTNLSFMVRSTAAGPSALGVTVNGSSVYTQDMTQNVTEALSLPLTGLIDLTQAVVAIQGWTNGTRDTTGGGEFQIDAVQVFGTVDEPVGPFAPLVSFPSVAGVLTDSASIGGTLGSTGGVTVTERGIYYSTNSGFTPPLQGTKVSETGSFGTGDFTVVAAGLTPDTVYYFRAFATNTAGLGLSDESSFQTLIVPPDNALAYYTFTGETPAAELTDPEVVANPLSVSAGSVTFGSASDTTWTNSGVPYAQGSGGWDAAIQSTSKYFLVELTAVSGKAMTLTNISFHHRRTSAGPTDTGIQVNGTDLAPRAVAADSTEFVSIPLVGQANRTSALIRIQGWGGGGGDYRVDDVLVQGFVTNEFPIANQIPILAFDPPGSPQFVQQDDTLTFDVVATQVPADSIDNTAVGAVLLPSGAVFAGVTSLPPATAAFSWTPATTGTYTAVFVASDKDGAVTQSVEIIVTPLPTAPDDTLAYYTFTGNNPAPEFLGTNVSATDAALSEGVIDFGTDQDTTWTGSGVPYAEALAGWTNTSQTGAKEYLFTVAADGGYTLTITNLRFRYRSTVSGPAAIGFAVDGTHLFNQGTTADVTVAVSEPVAGYAGVTSATFSIQGWNDGSRPSTGGGAFRLDDILVQGSVDQLPVAMPVDFVGVTVDPNGPFGPVLSISFGTETGFAYTLQSSSDLTADPVIWQNVNPPTPGDGTVLELPDLFPLDDTRAYRVLAD